MVAPSGTTFPASPDTGELFFISGSGGADGLYAYDGAAWLPLAGGGGGGGSTFIVSGDVSGILDGGADALTLATVNSNLGSFGGSSAIPVITVNAKGQITAASTTNITAPAGNLTGTALAPTVVSSSLTSVGTLTSLTVAGAITGSLTGAASQNVLKVGDTLSGFLTLHANPVAANHAATKTYVDTQVLSVDGLPTFVVVAGVSQLAAEGFHYILTNSTGPTTVTLPPSPTPGALIWISNFTGRVDAVIDGNLINIMALAENMIFNINKATVQLRYMNATVGWIIL